MASILYAVCTGDLSGHTSHHLDHTLSKPLNEALTIVTSISLSSLLDLVYLFILSLK